MLTVRFERLGLTPDDLLLDAGAGFGRHAFEAARLGARVVALDYASDEVTGTRSTFAAMAMAGEIHESRCAGVLRGDATSLPFPNATFDKAVTSEVLEHIPNDAAVLGELFRVLKPGGVLAATVPTSWPERVCWRLSDDYHAPNAVGGHVRIYSSTELRAKLRAAGFQVYASHHAHALHSPYWWLRCAVGPGRDDHGLVARYRRFLEWDIMNRPRSVRMVEKVLNPVLGKSFVLYARKPASSEAES
jgi:SAM-dependent methyltransferase